MAIRICYVRLIAIDIKAIHFYEVRKKFTSMSDSLAYCADFYFKKHVVGNCQALNPRESILNFLLLLILAFMLRSKLEVLSLKFKVDLHLLI